MFKRSKRKYVEGTIKTARRKYVNDQIALLKLQIDDAKFRQATAEAARDARIEDAMEGDLGVVKDTETAAMSGMTLDQKIEALGGGSKAISKVQQDVFSEVEEQAGKAKAEMRIRKREQLNKRVMQRKRSGMTGRASLLTGMTGGKGYR